MPRRSRNRYRSCSACGAVRAASEFRRMTGQRNVTGQMERRICPGCGEVRPLMGFPIVEPPQDG
jgi:hypothetical protein